MEEIIRILILILKAVGYAIQAMADFFLYYADNKFYKKHTFWYIMGGVLITISVVLIMVFWE